MILCESPRWVLSGKVGESISRLVRRDFFVSNEDRPLEISVTIFCGDELVAGIKVSKIEPIIRVWPKDGSFTITYRTWQ